MTPVLVINALPLLGAVREQLVATQRLLTTAMRLPTAVHKWVLEPVPDFREWVQLAIKVVVQKAITAPVHHALLRRQQAWLAREVLNVLLQTIYSA